MTEAEFAELNRELDAKAHALADLLDVNELQRETILKISRLVRFGHKAMDLEFRKDGRDYRFEADWIALLFRNLPG